MNARKTSRSLAFGLVALSSTAAVAAEPAPPPQGEPVEGAPVDAPKPKPKPDPWKRAAYSLPWLLRPGLVPNVIRLDFPIVHEKKAPSGTPPACTSPDGAVVPCPGFVALGPVLTAGGKPFEKIDLGFYGRLGMTWNGLNQTGAVSNGALLALFNPEVIKGLRITSFLGVTLPWGMGSGNCAPGATGPADAKCAQPGQAPAQRPAYAERAAILSGIYSRQAMDNALFATNYMTPMGGVGVVVMDRGLTLQTEITVLQLIRVQGELHDTDEARTNFTWGTHLGYTFFRWVTASLEVHYQHWLGAIRGGKFEPDPNPVVASAAAKNQLTFGGGVRVNLPIPGGTMLRPGFSFFSGLDAPMGRDDYRIFQLDLPFFF